MCFVNILFGISSLAYMIVLPPPRDTRVHPFEHNLSIWFEELNRTRQYDNPHDSDDEQSESSEL